jgi:hypothetical protein
MKKRRNKIKRLMNEMNQQGVKKKRRRERENKMSKKQKRHKVKLSLCLTSNIP